MIMIYEPYIVKSQWPTRRWRPCHPKLIRFDTILACDGRMHGL